MLHSFYKHVARHFTFDVVAHGTGSRTIFYCVTKRRIVSIYTVEPPRFIDLSTEITWIGRNGFEFI